MGWYNICMERIILHSDLNNFYASVECLYNPQLRQKPVAVAGDLEKRHGIVLAKNELAKKYGVATGDPLWLAQKKCKDIVFTPPHFERYLEYSAIAREIYSDFTDQVESFGLDECWLDVTASTALFGSGREIADKIRARIKRELGVTASVGVSFNKIFAKLGSDMKKPDATTVIDRRRFKELVWPLPVGELLYVGRATRSKLLNYGIDTIGKLAAANPRFLQNRLGKMGIILHRFANGLDCSPVSNIGAKSLIKSIGNSTTAPHDLVSDEHIKITLYALCQSVSARMRELDFYCRTVQISVRDNKLESVQLQKKLETPCRTCKALFEAAFELIKTRYPGKNPIRSIGVRACDLFVQQSVQLSMLDNVKRLQKAEVLESTLDKLRERFGPFAVERGIMLADRSLSSISPKDDNIIHPIGFFK